MKKDIYYLLNHVKTDLEAYDIRELEKSEIRERTEGILYKLHSKDAYAGKCLSFRKFIQAAVFLAAVLLSVGGVAYAATDGELFRYMYTFLSGGGIYETTERSITGEESTVTVVMGEAASVDENGNTKVGIPLLFRDGRLYFTGDGSETDITDEISEEEPYYIDVIDEMGNTHKFMIGGRAEPGCYGYKEILIDSEGVVHGGVGSCGAKVDDSAPWLQKADEETMNLYIQQP